MTTKAKLELPPNWDHKAEQIGFQKDAWLRKRGWRSTSTTPGCYWMWQKELTNPPYSDEPGKVRTFVVDQETAVRIEEHLQSMEYYDAYPEEMGD